jgi:membrane protein implicated in regulation of membrane protease activity
VVVVLLWVLLFVVLVLVELHHLAFYSLFVAIGCLAAALVALVAPDAIAVQGIVAAIVSVAGVVLARPYVSKAFHQHNGGHVAAGVHGGLVGQEAFTLDRVGGTQETGHVRLAGERWLAMTGGPAIAPGHQVVVTAVRGTTLEVWPVDFTALDPPSADTESNP